MTSDDAEMDVNCCHDYCAEIVNPDLHPHYYFYWPFPNVIKAKHSMGFSSIQREVYICMEMT